MAASITSVKDTRLFRDIMRISEQRKGNKPSKEPEYKCDKCKDTGFVAVIDDEGHERWDNCECKIAKWNLERLENSGINDYIHKSLDNYTVKNPEQQGIKKLAKRYIDSDSLDNVILCGGSGTGKTHIAAAMLIGKIKKGRSGKYVSYKDYIRQCGIKARARDSEEYARYFSIYANTSYLLLDDLFKGAEKGKEVSDTHLSYMYELINYRYTKGLATIVTSELTLDQLVSIDEALAGRLIERAGRNIVQIKTIKNQRLK